MKIPVVRYVPGSKTFIWNKFIDVHGGWKKTYWSIIERGALMMILVSILVPGQRFEIWSVTQPSHNWKVVEGSVKNGIGASNFRYFIEKNYGISRKWRKQ